MENYVETFKNYVPAEILAAFIAINSFVPYDAPTDIYIISASIAALTVLFVVSSMINSRFKSVIKLSIVTVTLPFWCFTIASTRFENLFPTDTLRVVISVALVIVSVSLTLLTGKSAPPVSEATGSTNTSQTGAA